MLSFLSPLSATKPAQDSEQQEGDPNVNEQRILETLSSRREKRKKLSEEQQLFQVLTENVKRKAMVPLEQEDPDKHFLLSLLPDFKAVPQHLKMDVKFD
ncbi:BESS motif [Popillia japonica]|uniref:BESS motif n=1 Tax=Popillia japonica TaxID=7064 RepID=A0AAW1MH01_POPJA